MQTFRRHLTAATAAVLMSGVVGVATAAALNNNAPHTNPAMRVYPACPHRDRSAIASTTAGSDAALVPADARAVLLCRYSGFGAGAKPIGPRSFRLTAHHLVTSRATTQSLASYLNGLKPVNGNQACPGDSGAAIIAFFRYGSAPKANDPVTLHLGGCSIVSNGRLNREASYTFVRQLESLAQTH
jgi:hypothetical protein